jgi:hypothetical protein
MLLFNSFLAYFVNLTNFLVTRYTSALTLQVLGNAKGVVAVVISVLCFRNPVTVYSMLGYAITVAGVVLYSQAKRSTKRAEALRKLVGRVQTPDVEQPKSPFSSTPADNGRPPPFSVSSDSVGVVERQPLLMKTGEMLNQEGVNGAMIGTHSRAMSGMSSSSDRMFPRGFSSIFEA